jgi:hypothetical protein
MTGMFGEGSNVRKRDAGGVLGRAGGVLGRVVQHALGCVYESCRF